MWKIRKHPNGNGRQTALEHSVLAIIRSARAQKKILEQRKH